MTHSNFPFVLLVALLQGCAYTAPVSPPDDFDGVPNVLSGDVVVNGVAPEDMGNVILLLTDATNPPPPVGTGRPLTFATVAASDFTGVGAGVQSAAFTISNVPDGTYILTGLMDADADFHPLISALAGATCGDVIGGHLQDVTLRTMAPITVANGELLDNVTVALAVELATERPAFWSSDGVPTVNRAEAATGTSQVFRIDSAPIHIALGSTLVYELEGPFDAENPKACQTSFLVAVADEDEDLAPDPHPDYGDLGLYDIGPDVFLTYLGVPMTDDAGQLTGFDDSALSAGESYNGKAVVHPQMLALGQLPPVGTLGSTTFLDLIWIPGALHTLADGTVESIANPADVPAGAWSISVVEVTGQTWTIPNELAAGQVVSGASVETQTQGAFLLVQ